MDMELDFANFYCQEDVPNIINDKISHNDSDFDDDDEDEKRHQRFKNEKRPSIIVNFDRARMDLALQKKTKESSNNNLADVETCNAFGICKTVAKQKSKTSSTSATNATENISTQAMQQSRKRKISSFSPDNEKTQNKLSILSRIKFSKQIKSTSQSSIFSRLGYVSSIPENNAISPNDSLANVLYLPTSKKLKVSSFSREQSSKQLLFNEDSFDHHEDDFGSEEIANSQIHVSLEKIKIGILGYSNKCSATFDSKNGALTLFLDDEKHKVDFKINCIGQVLRQKNKILLLLKPNSKSFISPIREFFPDEIRVSIDWIKPSSSLTNIELFVENLDSEYETHSFEESLRNALTKHNLAADLKPINFSEIVFLLEFQNKNHLISINTAVTLPIFVKLLQERLNSKYIEIPFIYPYSRKGNLYIDSEKDWNYCKQSAISAQAYNPFDVLTLRILEYLY
ncbi:634_t:CDS:2 [Ambispora leptoticha]|uniref:634_t:CDS:1 n=1 Tax=Ambispora leptoticha TaxID=144679 RepID=A0A9N8WE01_9GLOM|nr:634_t:CDS:2 [Ambispora leptoticha]